MLPIENIPLFDLLPWKLAPLPAQLVTKSRELFFPTPQLRCRFEIRWDVQPAGLEILNDNLLHNYLQHCCIVASTMREALTRCRVPS